MVAADLLSVVVFKTHAGTRDEGGVLQPAYLNFDAALLGPPAHDLKVCPMAEGTFTMLQQALSI